MLEQILQWERSTFLFLNGSNSSFLDNFMWLYSFKFTWIPFYLCFLIIFVYKKNWKEILWICLMIGLLVLLCDQISSGLFKPYFQRFRPTHHPDFMNDVKTVFGYKGGSYGFISGHACNSFGFAMFTSLLFRNKVFTIMIFIFALLTAYSRVYLGVHFISDIVAGAVVGTIIGLLVYEIYVFGQKHIFSVVWRKLRKAAYTSKQAYFLIGAYVFMLGILAIFNKQLVELLVK